MTRRIFVIGASKVGLLLLLAGRMFYMQFIKKDQYKTLSDKNRIKIIILNPVRGKIFDKANRIIAKNNTCFQLFLDKNGNPKFNNELHLVSELLKLDEQQIYIMNKMTRRGGWRIPAVIIDCLTWNQVAIIEERNSEFKSISINTGFNRYYNSSISMAHIIGYLGRSSNDSGVSNKLIDENLRIGKNGIEKYYELYLRGEFGYKRIEVNAGGKYVRSLDKIRSVEGQSLYLNIDSELQDKAMGYLSPQGCSAIVMDCNTGNVVICASAPSYDLNQFNKLSTKYWNNLIHNPYLPLVNKTIGGAYPPGSIFKIITAIAALESGINPNQKIVCTGGPVLGGNKFRCSRSRGHGPITMIDALKYSCNSYIYDVARQIGADKIIAVAEKFGFGSKTLIDLPGELSGFVPSRQWKKDKYQNRWRIGDTLNLSIGQGFLLTTPMQLVRMISAVATNGKLFVPKVATFATQAASDMSHKATHNQIDLDKNHIDIIKAGLFRVMNSRGGTGYFNRLDYKNIQMAGKTGTAQVRAKKNASDNLSSADVAWRNRNHAIFTGYAPFNDPKFAIAVYYDHGGGGGRCAAPIAKKIMTDLLSKYC